jgi:spermidine/putrescine transport system ATP-binding protein
VASASTNDIEFRSVTKTLWLVTAVTDINLNVPKGAFLALLGPSGCGKTTCLRMIGGFEQPSEGTVLIDGREMNGVPAYRRPVNMVFQHYALFPAFQCRAERCLWTAPDAAPDCGGRDRPPGR